MTESKPAGPPELGLARKALEDARAAAKAAGKTVGQGRSVRTPQRLAGRRRWSGPGLDARDPQTLGFLARSVSQVRGWDPHIIQGQLFAQWDAIVGTEIAGHATPTELTDRVLSISAESTAWATQLRLMQRDILRAIAKEVGHDVVESVRITGPRPPSWRKGPRTVPGRGPRDTYG